MSEGAKGKADEASPTVGQAAQDSAVEGQGLASGGTATYVLDSSALLCLMNDEPGAERVAAVLPRAVVSAVNLAEVVTKLNELGPNAEEARALLAPLHLAVLPFDEGMALATGALRAATRDQGLSFGDRACLALAKQRAAVALTADRAWTDVGATVSVQVEMLK